MKKLIIFALFAACSLSFSQIDFKKGSVAEIFKMAKDQNKPVMVDVMTDWCVWCVELDNLVYSQPEIYNYANQNQVNYKIDAEKGEGIEFAKKYKVEGFPTILFIDGDGNEIDRIFGYYPLAQFKELMSDYSKGINTMKDLTAKLEADANNIEANYKMGEKMMTSDKLDDAKAKFKKVIDLDPENKSGRKDDAEYMLADMSEKNDIVKNLEAFINNNPESNLLKDAYTEVANAYSNNNDNANAEKWFKEALTKFEGDMLVKISYSRYLNSLARTIGKDTTSKADDFRNALGIIDKSLTYTPLNSTAAAQAFYWQSMLHYKLKEYSEAMESIEKAIKIFDNKTYREQRDKVEKQLSSR
jgi:thioredoxin-related protein